jgi:hypothetical protein
MIGNEHTILLFFYNRKHIKYRTNGNELFLKKKNVSNLS